MFTGQYNRFQSAIGFSKPINNVGDLVNAVVPFVFGIAGFLLLLYLISGGFGILNSKGDTKALEAAKNKITSALVGFIIIFVVFWLVQIFGFILGLPGMNVGGGGSVSPST